MSYLRAKIIKSSYFYSSLYSFFQNLMNFMFYIVSKECQRQKIRTSKKVKNKLATFTGVCGIDLSSPQAHALLFFLYFFGIFCFYLLFLYLTCPYLYRYVRVDRTGGKFSKLPSKKGTLVSQQTLIHLNESLDNIVFCFQVTHLALS